MIPFAVLQGKLIFINGDELEFSADELSEKSVVFRLPSGYYETHGAPEAAVFSFYNHEKCSYATVQLSGYSFELIRKEKYADCFRINTADVKFASSAKNLTNFYLKYIDYRLYHEDDEMSNFMTYGKYPLDEHNRYDENTDCAEKEWITEVQKRNLLSSLNCSLFFSAEKGEILEKFLSDGTAAFFYAELNTKKPDGIVLGNAFCEQLFPEAETLKKTADITVKENLIIMLNVPPVSELNTEKFCRIILEFADYLKAGNISGTVIQFNDYGMYSWACNRLREYEFIHPEKGVLLYKSKRDPRKKFLNDYSGKSASDNFMYSENSIFGPYFQTNTGTFCPLHSIITTGRRGNQKRVSECVKYCRDYYLQYPSFLSMKGEGNSLFGFQKEFLTDEHFSELLREKEIRRVVINL